MAVPSPMFSPDKTELRAEGLKRRGFSAASIVALKRAYKILYRSSFTLDEARRKLAGEVANCPDIQVLLDFLAGSTRGIVR